MNPEEIAHIIELAVENLRREAPPLDFAAVHERSTAHRLAVHLDRLFEGWNVDCEYDRNGRFRKLLAGIKECRPDKTTDEIVPDIIVHHRMNQGREHNLLVIELKKNAAEDACDMAKLRLLTATGGPYEYQFGLFINIDGGNFTRVWFSDGEIAA
jgi:hypothetical protein